MGFSKYETFFLFYTQKTKCKNTNHRKIDSFLVPFRNYKSTLEGLHHPSFSHYNYTPDTNTHRIHMARVQIRFPRLIVT